CAIDPSPSKSVGVGMPLKTIPRWMGVLIFESGARSELSSDSIWLGDIADPGSVEPVGNNCGSLRWRKRRLDPNSDDGVTTACAPSTAMSRRVLVIGAPFAPAVVYVTSNPNPPVLPF